MGRAKAFLAVCAGVFLLALAYHFGATAATAQSPANPVVATFPGGGGYGNFGVVTSEGDIYVSNDTNGPWTRVSNVFSAPTPAQRESWGALKQRYR